MSLFGRRNNISGNLLPLAFIPIHSLSFHNGAYYRARRFLLPFFPGGQPSHHGQQHRYDSRIHEDFPRNRTRETRHPLPLPSRRSRRRDFRGSRIRVFLLADYRSGNNSRGSRDSGNARFFPECIRNIAAARNGIWFPFHCRGCHHGMRGSRRGNVSCHCIILTVRFHSEASSTRRSIVYIFVFTLPSFRERYGSSRCASPRSSGKAFPGDAMVPDGSGIHRRPASCRNYCGYCRAGTIFIVCGNLYNDDSPRLLIYPSIIEGTTRSRPVGLVIGDCFPFPHARP